MAYALADDYSSLPPSHSNVTVSTNTTIPNVLSLFAVKKGDTFGVNTLQTYAVIQKVRSLKAWGDNWDDSGAIAVTPAAIERATLLIGDMYSISQTVNIDWTAPNVTANPHGEIVLEWWKKEKKLTIYISENACDYVKVWGPDIDEDMDDGVLTQNGFADLMRWMET